MKKLYLLLFSFCLMTNALSADEEPLQIFPYQWGANFNGRTTMSALVIDKHGNQVYVCDAHLFTGRVEIECRKYDVRGLVWPRTITPVGGGATQFKNLMFWMTSGPDGRMVEFCDLGDRFVCASTSL
jgi:hypothetical protein